MSATGLVIFDLDGTLFRSDSVTVPAVQGSFTDYGLPVPARETILPLIGTPIDDLRTWVRERCPRSLADELYTEIERRELGLIASEGRLYGGVRDTQRRMYSAGV